MFNIAKFTILKLTEPAFMFLTAFGFILAISASGQQLQLEFFNEVQGSSGNLDIGTFMILMLASLSAVFVGASEIPRDLQTRLITIILSKPISRKDYVIGTFLGTWALASMLYLSWLLTLGIFQYVRSPDLFNAGHWCLNWVYIFSLAPVSAIAVTVSTFLDDVPSMIVSFIIIAVSFIMGSVPYIVELFSGDLGRLLLLFYYLLPNAAYFFRSFDAVWHVFAYIIYIGALSSICLKVAITHFEERDLC